MSCRSLPVHAAVHGPDRRSSHRRSGIAAVAAVAGGGDVRRKCVQIGRRVSTCRLSIGSRDLESPRAGLSCHGTVVLVETYVAAATPTTAVLHDRSVRAWQQLRRGAGRGPYWRNHWRGRLTSIPAVVDVKVRVSAWGPVLTDAGKRRRRGSLSSDGLHAKGSAVLLCLL